MSSCCSAVRRREVKRENTMNCLHRRPTALAVRWEQVARWLNGATSAASVRARSPTPCHWEHEKQWRCHLGTGRSWKLTGLSGLQQICAFLPFFALTLCLFQPVPQSTYRHLGINTGDTPTGIKGLFLPWAYPQFPAAIWRQAEVWLSLSYHLYYFYLRS